MKLIVHELEAGGLEQIITPDKNTNVEAIRPHLVRYGHPVGTLKLELYDESAALVATSSSVTIDDIGSMDYFHGYVLFPINVAMKRDQAYTLKLVAEDGYTFDESAYVGWVNGHDLAKYPINGTPASHFNYPIDYEVWARTNK